MGWKTIVPVAAALACGGPAAATAQEKPANAASAISANEQTREQFLALPADAVIDFNGEHITKSEFQARNSKAVQEGAEQLQDARARAQAGFEARRKTLLEKRAAALAEANKKGEAEIAKLVAADDAAHGANWQARKKQAADLFDKAANAPSIERSALLKQAADLLAPPAK
jgi:hypothetical protein